MTYSDTATGSPAKTTGKLAGLLANRSLATKILAAVALGVIVAVVVGVQGILSANTSMEREAAIGDKVSTLNGVALIKGNLAAAYQGVLKSLGTTSATDTATYLNAFGVAIKTGQTKLATVRDTVAANPERFCVVLR